MAVIMMIVMIAMMFMAVILMTLKVTLQSMSSKGILGLSGLTNGGKIKVVYLELIQGVTNIFGYANILQGDFFTDTPLKR